MAYENLKSAIKQAIKQNGNQEITGNLLQSTLLNIVNTIGADYKFLGFATPSTVPPTSEEGRLLYFTTGHGDSYVNFPTSASGTYITLEYGIYALTREANSKYWRSYAVVPIAQELGTALDKVVSQNTIKTELGKKADKDTVNTELGKKADKETVNTELGKKADKETVNTELNKAIMNSSYNVGSKYTGNNVGWTSQTGIEPASNSFIVTQLAFVTNKNIKENFNSTLRVAIVTLSDDWSTIVEVNEITDDLNLVNLKNSTFYQVEVEGITIQKNQILCAKGLGFEDSNRETIGGTIFFTNDSDMEVGKPVSKYYMNSPFFYVPVQACIRKLQKATASNINKYEFNRAIKTLYSIGSPYSNNNVGWTSQTGIEPASDSFIVTHLSFTTNKNIKENFNSTLRVAIVTLSDDWSTIVEVNEITDDLNLVNLKNSTFYQVEVEGITIQKNQILCAKGLGFDISNKETIDDTIFFTNDSDMEVGKPVSKYYMNSPFFYVQVQACIRKLQKATASNINKDVKLMVFGDSITDTEVSGMGELINSLLNTTLIQNFARGNATLSDYSNTGGENITQISLEKQKNEAINTNVLSNQVRRAIQYTSALNSKLTWNHPIYGEYSIDETYGKGLGHVSDIPDIIYIALGTNDTKTSMLNNMLNDNYEQLYSQKYNNVNTTNIFGALLWAVETLRCVYPKAQIFIETPLQTKRLWGSNQNLCNDRIFKARNIIIKAANFLSCHVIDSYAESGFNELIAQNVNDGIHPTGMWKQLIGQYIAKQIKNNYFHK